MPEPVQPVNEYKIKISGSLPAIEPGVIEKGKQYVVAIGVEVKEEHRKDNEDGTDDIVYVLKVNPEMPVVVKPL